jgi:hypothetical protein
MYINQAIDLTVKMFLLQLKTKERFAIEFVSGPGIGKSQIPRQAAAKIARVLGKPVGEKPFFLTTVESIDVRGVGLPSQDHRKMIFTLAPWMPILEEGDPEHGFVFLDEWGQSPDDVKKPAAELLLNGAVGCSRLPITWMVLAASNRTEDRSGVGREMAFTENRKMRVVIEPNLDAWVEWAETHGIHPFTIAFAKYKPGLVFQDAVPSKPGPFCTPRTLCKVSNLIGELDMGMFTEAAAGYIGEGTAAEFVAFLRVTEQLPPYEEIVANPDKARVPDRPDANYATMQMVAHRVDAKTAEPAFRYLKRMGKEFQVAGLKATLRRCPQLVQTPEFAHWLRENKDLIMAANLMDRR